MSEIRVGEYGFQITDSNKLGNGTYASVYLGHHLGSMERVAIKVINKLGKSPQDLKYLNQEIEVMKKIKHPNTVRLLENQQVGGFIYLVLEFCSGKDLKSYLEKQPQKRLDEDTARHFMCQIATALRYLHDSHIIHRDLKPQNILLSEESPRAEIKICDFGFARVEAPQMDSILGSPLYMAPEILCGKSYTNKSDLWSVGCIFYEMLMGHPPLSPTSMNHLRNLVQDEKPIVYPIPISPLCRELLEGLLQKKSSLRFDWNQFLGHSYLTTENLTRSTCVDNSHLNQELPSRNAWLQHIYFFHPHGDVVTLYVRPQHTFLGIKAALEKLSTTPIRNQLLLDTEGKELVDNLTLSHYNFHQAQKPIYFVHWDILAAGLSLPSPPLDMRTDIPHPNISVPIESKIDPTDPPLKRLSAIHENWTRKSTVIKEIYQNVKAIEKIISTANTKHEYQHDVYKVVRSHMIRMQAELVTAFKPIEAAFAVFRETVTPVLSSFESSINGLKKTAVHSALAPLTKCKYLIDFFDEKKIYEQNKMLSDELASLTNMKNQVAEELEKIKRDGDNLAITKLNDKSVTQIRKSKEIVTNEVIQSKSELSKFQNTFKFLARNFNDFRTNPRKSDSEVEEYLTRNISFDGLNSVFVNMKKIQETTDNWLQICEAAKKTATREMVVNLNGYGKVLLDINRIRLLMNNIQTTTNRHQSTIQDLKRVVKFGETYEHCLKEISRRKEFSKKVQLAHQSIEKYFKELQTSELVMRQSFRECNPSLIQPFASLLLKPEQEEKNITTIQLSLKISDSDLPEIGPLPTALEDDFSVIIEEYTNPHEVLKNKEEENGRLRFELQEVTKRLKEANLILSSTLGTPDTSQRLQTAIKEKADLQTDNVKLQEKNQLLLTKINSLQTQINKTSVPVRQTSNQDEIEELRRRLEQVEASKALAEEALTIYAKDDIKKIQDMGFTLEQTKKALVLNRCNVQQAIHWLLEGTHKI